MSSKKKKSWIKCVEQLGAEHGIDTEVPIMPLHREIQNSMTIKWNRTDSLRANCH